jgi:hypothetical protein
LRRHCHSQQGDAYTDKPCSAFGAPGFAVTLLDPFWFIAVAVTMTIRAIRGEELAQPI